MNNVEEFYRKERLLKSVTYRTLEKNSFFYRVHMTNASINIVLNDDLIQAIEAKEIGTIKWIIQEWINKHREEIEKHLVSRLKEGLEASRLLVNQDFKEFKKVKK